MVQVVPSSRVVGPATDPLRLYHLLTSSYKRALAAENKSPRTIETYAEALKLFGDFLVAQGMPTDPEYIAREHVEAFITDLLRRFKPATASNCYRALQSFFKWAVSEDELPRSPMERMKPLSVPDSLTLTRCRRTLPVKSSFAGSWAGGLHRRELRHGHLAP